MSNFKFLALTALSCSLLTGCASHLNSAGLPRWLERQSQANQIGYFMGISLKDSPAPTGYDPTKNTLLSDLTFSGVTHGLNVATGALDIGSFGMELGLSFAINLLKREEEEYSQALMYFAASDYESKKAASDAAMLKLGDHIAQAIEPLGYKTLHKSSFVTWGIKHRMLYVENPKIGCTNKDEERCFIYVKFDEDWMKDEPYNIGSYMQLSFAPAWEISHLRVTYHSPKGSRFEMDMPNVLKAIATNLPPNTWFYVAPMLLEKRWTVPYVSDGINAHFFIRPQSVNKPGPTSK